MGHLLVLAEVKRSRSISSLYYTYILFIYQHYVYQESFVQNHFSVLLLFMTGTNSAQIFVIIRYLSCK